MPETRDIIVIGASAGGIEALQRLVRGLPSDLPAAVFVVIHIPPWAKSVAPQVLSSNGNLTAIHPEPDQRFERGRIYIAPPDHHLLLDRERIQLWRGPKENRHRPAVNPLFRSAAVNHKQRVIGVILSGILDDGTTGLWWVKKFGGAAIVQDPQDAAFPDMPRNALEHVAVDYIAGASEIGPLLAALVAGNETNQKARVLAEEPSTWRRKRS